MLYVIAIFCIIVSKRLFQFFHRLLGISCDDLLISSRNSSLKLSCILHRCLEYLGLYESSHKKQSGVISGDLAGQFVGPYFPI